jgi:hypothetical protein
MHLLVAAMTGWGKGYFMQGLAERNAPEYDHLIMCDYADEFRGLVEADMAEWWIAGPKERGWSPETWVRFVEDNPKLVLAKHDHLTTDDWTAVCANVAEAVKYLDGSVLVILDEAHIPIPQKGEVPDPLSWLATTGRGERVSFVAATQRLAKIDKDVTTQMQSQLLGGFEGRDLKRAKDEAEGYPGEVHNSRADPPVPESIAPDDRDHPTGVQLHTDDADNIIGSEWIFADNRGDRRRVDTRGMDLETTHYAPQGADLDLPA